MTILSVEIRRESARRSHRFRPCSGAAPKVSIIAASGFPDLRHDRLPPTVVEI